ncbi:MAG: hypothetical protein AAGG08_06520 [Actinomycetota bacterium]
MTTWAPPSHPRHPASEPATAVPPAVFGVPAVPGVPAATVDESVGASDWMSQLDDEPGRTAERRARPHRTAPLKWLWAVSTMAAGVAGLVSPITSIVPSLLSIAALMAWSALSAATARRARAATVYQSPVSSIAAALSWLAAPVIVGVGVLATRFVLDSTEIGALMPDDRRTEAIVVVGVLVTVLPFAVAVYLPFRLLGRVTAWVGGSPRRWRQFFWLPLLTALLAALLQVIALPGTRLALSDGAPDGAIFGAVGLLLLLVALPPIVALWTGWAAMTETEQAARMTWEQLNFPVGELDLSSELAARAAMRAYLDGRAGS